MTRGRRVQFSDEQLRSLAKRYQDGASFQDFANELGCGKNTIRAALLAIGVQPDVRRSIGAKAKGRPSPRKGVTHTVESRAKMSVARRGRAGTRFGPHSAETLAKISAGTKGKNIKYTPEQWRHIESIRQSCKRFVRRVLSASGKRKTTPSQQLLGYTTAQLWARLGPRPEGAHLDHIVPMADFFRRGIFDPAVINALDNLQWLPGAENRRKSDKLNWERQA